MKEAEGVEPTVMWLAPSLHTLWFLLSVTPPIFFFFSGNLTFFFEFQVDHYSVFSEAKPVCAFLGLFFLL